MIKRSSPEAPRSETVGGLNAFLDQGSSFEGKLTFQGVVRIDGRFSGEILSDDTLQVGNDGIVEGVIVVGNAVISGTVRGKLRVSGRVEFRTTAVFEGEIEAGRLVVEDGARLDGRIAMAAAFAQAGEPAAAGLRP